jgi:uncharacterized membrane protein (UPF0127 family)
VRRLLLAACSLLAGLFVAGSCDSAEPAGSPASPLGDQSPLFADATAPTLDELRAAHDVVGEGAVCRTDLDCESPLRCAVELCTWPPAMLGEVTGSTPMMLLRGEHDEQQYFIELALTAEETRRGLMHRQVMVPNFGMLFVFDSDRPRSFWMRNTLIPLDMVFIRSDGVIDSVQENAEPLTESPRPSTGAARYVLELNAGEVERLGLRAGSAVAFMNLPAVLAPARK